MSRLNAIVVSVAFQSMIFPFTAEAQRCRAKLDATTYANFMCYNLGAANTSADPFTPGWEVIGGYWQWGRKVQGVAGPAGPGAGQTNEQGVSGWNVSAAPKGAWTDASRTASDPCPAGYRIPTSEQWYAVIRYNEMTYLGTWSASPSNYSSGTKIGAELMLPATGSRNGYNGSLHGRGSYGSYWSSSEDGDQAARGLYITNSESGTRVSGGFSRIFGLSVRCIAE